MPLHPAPQLSQTILGPKEAHTAWGPAASGMSRPRGVEHCANSAGICRSRLAYPSLKPFTLSEMTSAPLSFCEGAVSDSGPRPTCNRSGVGRIATGPYRQPHFAKTRLSPRGFRPRVTRPLSASLSQLPQIATPLIAPTDTWGIWAVLLIAAAGGLW